MVPQNLPTPATTTGFPAHDAKLLRYQDVLLKMSASNTSGQSDHQALDSGLNVSDGWASDDEVDEPGSSFTPIKSEGVGPLLGGFSDAETVTD